MATILEEICNRKRRDLEIVKQRTPPNLLFRSVERMMAEPLSLHSLRQSLLTSSTGIIAEFKRKSPSLGWINEQALPEKVIPAYMTGGATALSILTDEPYFGGTPDFIQRVRPLVDITILRKDFILDEYQVFEARKIGADAILLIAACLRRNECLTLARLAHELQLEVLLEIHEEKELDFLSDFIDVVGVNNRNLHLFQTDIKTSFRLSALIPHEFVRISESGIHTADDIHLLQEAGFNGFLMGERFMKEADPAQALVQFIKTLEA